MIIVGSTAIKLLGRSYRTPKDCDILVRPTVVFEGYDCVPLPKRILKKVPWVPKQLVKNGQRLNVMCITLDGLLTLKCSHFHLDIAWEKTKLDILWLMSQGAKILPELFIQLKKHWDTDKGRKIEVSLNMSAAEFFATGSKFPYEHDQLHLWAAGNNAPMYSKCLVDGQEVLVDKEKFKAMSHEDQLQMIREEIAVIACERWLLNPKTKVTSPILAWQYALRKVITTLMKGYFSEFVIHNLPAFIKVDKVLLNNILNNAKQNEDNMESDILQEFKDLMNYHLAETGESEDYVVIESPPEGVRIVEQEGGESEGEYAYTVWEWRGEFFRLDYSYYSYNGYENIDLDNIRHVKKVERTVSFYE